MGSFEVDLHFTSADDVRADSRVLGKGLGSRSSRRPREKYSIQDQEGIVRKVGIGYWYMIL